MSEPVAQQPPLEGRGASRKRSIPKQESDDEGGGASSIPDNRGTGEIKGSCDWCSSAKKLCNKELPCANCSKRGIACRYSEKRRRGPVKGAKYKPRSQTPKQAPKTQTAKRKKETSDAGPPLEVGLPVAKVEVMSPRAVVTPSFSDNGKLSPGSGSGSDFKDWNSTIPLIHAPRIQQGPRVIFGAKENAYVSFFANACGSMLPVLNEDSIRRAIAQPRSPKRDSRLQGSAGADVAGSSAMVVAPSWFPEIGEMNSPPGFLHPRAVVHSWAGPSPYGRSGPSVMPLSNGSESSAMQCLQAPEENAVRAAACAVLWSCVAVGAILHRDPMSASYLALAELSLEASLSIVNSDTVRACLILGIAALAERRLLTFSQFVNRATMLWDGLPLDCRSPELAASLNGCCHLLNDPMADPDRYRNVLLNFTFPLLKSKGRFALNSLSELWAGMEIHLTQAWMLERDNAKNGIYNTDQTIITMFAQNEEVLSILSRAVEAISQSQYPRSVVTLTAIRSWLAFYYVLNGNVAKAVEHSRAVAEVLIESPGAMLLEPIWHYAHVLGYVIGCTGDADLYRRVQISHNNHTPASFACHILPPDPANLIPLNCCTLEVCQDLCANIQKVCCAWALSRAPASMAMNFQAM